MKVLRQIVTEGIEAGEARATFAELSGVHGLTFQERARAPLDIKPLQQLLISINQWLLEANLQGIAIDKLPDNVEPLMELITSSRSGLRDAKLWEYADKIRDKLGELDIALEDAVNKDTVWKRKR